MREKMRDAEEEEEEEDREGRQAKGGRNSHAARVSQRSRGRKGEGDGREKHGGERPPSRKREKRRPLRFPQRRRFSD